MTNKMSVGVQLYPITSASSEPYFFSKLAEVRRSVAWQAQESSDAQNADLARAPGERHPCRWTIRTISDRKKPEEKLPKTGLRAKRQNIAHSFEYGVDNRTTGLVRRGCRIQSLKQAGPSPTYELMMKSPRRHIG